MQIESSSARLAPNEQLRWERQRRGWSRAYIAEQIGVADPKTIGRWERGSAFPSAYFLQKLCALFQMPAEELGLCQPENQPSTPARVYHYFTHSNHLQAIPAAPFCDPELPPAPDKGLVGRESLLHLLKRRLCAGGSLAVSALSGLPGVGKTALALQLAHDNDLQQHLSDGVLWVSLGPEADVLGELRRWGELLEIAESRLPHQESAEDWARAIHARIGARKMLLIIDDAWTYQDALAFKIGGPNCAYLLTTRIPAVALYFANTGTSVVKELDEEESLVLLEHFVPEVVKHEPAAVRELVRLAGGLPLVLQLMGKYLQTQVYSGQPRRWRAALDRLKQAETRLQLTMPCAPLERPMGLPTGTPLSLQAALALSYRQLDPAARQALVALAVLPAKPGSFSEEEALARGVSLEALDSLLDAGLLESTGPGRYTLHQTIVDYIGCQKATVTSSMASASAKVRMLRPLHERLAPPQDKQLLQDYPREENLPALIYESGGEAATLC